MKRYTKEEKAEILKEQETYLATHLKKMRGKVNCEIVMTQLEQTQKNIREMVSKTPALFPNESVSDHWKEGYCGENGYIEGVFPF